MNKKIIQLVVLIVLCLPKIIFSQVQDNCNTTIIKTDPSNYYNPNDPTQNLKWDWRGDIEYPIWLKTGINSATTLNLTSPFWADNTFTSQNNVDYLRINLTKDYEPIDGWELIYKNFGKPSNVNDAVADPSFALYNKYTGILRFFIYIASNPGAYNAARINLTYDATSNTQDKIAYNLLDNSSKLISLDKRIHNIIASKINYFSNNFGYWLHADFPVTYDPCVCKHLSILSLDPRIIKTGNITLEIQGRVTQEVVKNGTASSNSSDLNSLFSVLSAGFNAGNAKYKKWSEFKNNIDATIFTQNDQIKSTLQTDFGKFPEWAKQIPELGRYIGLFEYFTGGGQESVKAIAPSNFDVSLKTTSYSNITISDPYGGVKFYTPGSNHINNAANFKPVYDEPLGIFNLIETPVLQFHPIPSNFTILPNSCFINGVKNELGENLNPGTQLILPAIRHYKVKNNLKYVINPSAEVEVLSIESQILFRPKTKILSNGNGNCKTYSKMFRGPVEVGPLNNNISYVERMKNIGLNIDYWPDDKTITSDNDEIEDIIYSTRLLPGSCFSETAFKVFHLLGDEEKIFCRVVVKLKRTDGSKQEILLVRTFKIDIEIAPNANLDLRYISSTSEGMGLSCDWTRNYVSSVPQTPFSNTLMETIPNNLVLSNLNFSSDNSPLKTFYAWEKITIGDNVIFPPSMQVVFKAGKEIEVNPNFTTMGNTEFTIGLPSPCDILLANSNNQIETFCNQIYNPLPLGLPKNEDTLNDQIISDKTTKPLFNAKIFPNPTNGNFNVLVFNDLSLDYTISLSDITGKILINNNYSKNETFQNIQTENLTSGIYFVTIRCGDKVKVEKLIIQAKVDY